MFLRNANVFVALFIMAAAVIAAPIYLVLALLLGSFLERHILEGYGFYISYAVIAVILIAIWWRVGLSPAQVNPERKRRFGWGHGLLASVNTLMLAGVVGPMVATGITGNAGMMNLLWLAVPVIAIGIIVWPLGLFMVRGSRA